MLLDEDNDIQNKHGVVENYESIDAVSITMQGEDKQYLDLPNMGHLYKDVDNDDELSSDGHENEEEKGITKPLPPYVPLSSIFCM